MLDRFLDLKSASFLYIIFASLKRRKSSNPEITYEVAATRNQLFATLHLCDSIAWHLQANLRFLFIESALSALMCLYLSSCQKFSILPILRPTLYLFNCYSSISYTFTKAKLRTPLSFKRWQQWLASRQLG